MDVRTPSAHLRPGLALSLFGVVVFALAAACGGGDGAVVVVPLTRTPESTPGATSVASPEPSSGTTTPSPTTVAIPPRPENVLAGANALVPYLAGDAGDIDGCLPEVVDEWRLGDIEGPRCLVADLDGDRAEEFAFVVSSEREGAGQPGDLWLFASADDGRRLLGSARSFANAVLDGVHILATDDLTGDGLMDVVVASQICGASACSDRFLIISGHRGQIEDLAPRDLDVAALESARVEDVTGDGRPDLVLHRGVTESAGAGPQRATVQTLSWNGLRFTIDEQPDPPVYLVHAIADADARFASGDFAGARDLYEQAAADRTLRDWRVETGSRPGRTELVPYALFRAGVAALRDGDSVGARALLERAFVGHELSLHGLAAAVYLEQLNAGKAPGEACRQVETFLQNRSTQFEQIWDYGYANPEHTIAGLCR